VFSKEEIVEEPVDSAAAAGSDDLSPSAIRSVAALVRRRPLSWRELMDDSALMASAFVGAAAAVVGVRVLRRR
jgi:hypothetical protein